MVCPLLHPWQVGKLNHIIGDADTERFRQKKEYDIVINERDILGTQVTRPSESLSHSLLYPPLSSSLLSSILSSILSSPLLSPILSSILSYRGTLHMEL